MDGVEIFLHHEIRDLDRMDDKRWEVMSKDLDDNTRKSAIAKFVFIGAGGGTLSLLDKSGIPEADGYGGFPISGQWLKCTNESVIERHAAKVYGKAAIGAPPMSVPHLDTRIIDGKKELLFGPYAGFSTRFLKHGSLLDLPRSIEWENIFPMLSAGWHNLSLTKYLIQQVSQSMDDRMEALREYYPAANAGDWKLEVAGQRVQVIKKDEEEAGILEFGTEVVSSADGSMTGLLGASPGASTAVSIMLGLLKRSFPDSIQTSSWQQTLKKLIPSYGQKLHDDPALCKQSRERTAKILQLNS
jgi:malate dehydrogenase (quinone)